MVNFRALRGRELDVSERNGDTAAAWQEFAAANQVSVDFLLSALGPILRNAGSSELGLRTALLQAVAAAH